MNAAALATAVVGGVLALIILKDSGESFRDRWAADNTGEIQASLANLPNAGVTVPFQLIKDNPILPVLLDGDEHLTCWIVDTGYGFSAVDERLADRLELKPTGSLSVQTLQIDELKATRIPSGAIFDLDTNKPVVKMPRHSAVIRNLPSTLESTHGVLSRCLKPGGILGITFLKHFVTRIDYKKATLSFFDPRRFNYTGKGARFDGWLEDEHYFLVPLRIEGVTANMALDTGAFATIMTRGFLDKYKKINGRPFSGSNGKVKTSFSESVITLNKVDVGRAELGQHVLSNLEVLYAPSDAPGLLSTDRFDGLLGYPILKHFVIYVVYEPTPYVIFE